MRHVDSRPIAPRTITGHGCPPRPPGRGPNGRRFCRWCHQEVPRGRRSYCNDECRQHCDFNLSKAVVFARDRWTCRICGSRNAPKPRLEVDHIVAVKDGGSHHPDNLRVLCSTCHKARTREQRIVQQRNVVKKNSKKECREEKFKVGDRVVMRAGSRALTGVVVSEGVGLMRVRHDDGSEHLWLSREAELDMTDAFV